MRKFLLLALVAAVGLFFSGCGKELNDENFAAYWIEAFEVETPEDAEKLADDYGWTAEDMDKYFDELMEDEERADGVIDAVAEENEDAAFALEMTLFPERAFEDLMDLDLGLEGLTEGLEEGLGELGEELEGAAEELEGALEELGDAVEEATE